MRILFPILILVAAAPPLSAQHAHHRDTLPGRSDVCRVAAEVIEMGDSRDFRRVSGYGPERREAWAYSMIRRCGIQGGAVIASEMLRRQHSRDLAQLQRVTAVTQELRDGRIFSAARAIARDPAASEPARVFALRTLGWALDPARVMSYGGLSGTTPGARCSEGTLISLEIRPGEPLPAGYAGQVKSLARTLADSAGMPQTVRRAAACVDLIAPAARHDLAPRR